MHFTGGMSTAMFILYPVFLTKLGASELLIGQVMGLAAAAAVLTRPIAGHLLDVLGSRRTLFWAGLLNLASILLLVPVRSIGAPLLGLTVVHAVAVGTLFASYFTYAAHIVPPERRIEGVAMFGVAGMLPNGLGPRLSEWLLDGVGAAGYFSCAAAFSMISLLVTLLLHDARGEQAVPGHAALEHEPRVVEQLERLGVRRITLDVDGTVVRTPPRHASTAGVSVTHCARAAAAAGTATPAR
jgi:MFS family permease